MKQKFEVVIAASKEKVWAAMDSPENMGRWQSGFHAYTHKTGVPGQVGSTAELVFDENGKHVVLVETVTEWEPEQMLAYEISGLPPLVQGVTNRWQIDATTANASRVTLSTNIQPGQRPPQRLAARALGRRLMQASDQMLDGLQARATSGGSQR